MTTLHEALAAVEAATGRIARASLLIGAAIMAAGLGFSDTLFTLGALIAAPATVHECVRHIRPRPVRRNPESPDRRARER